MDESGQLINIVSARYGFDTGTEKFVKPSRDLNSRPTGSARELACNAVEHRDDHLVRGL